MRARGDRSEFWGDYVDRAVTPAYPFGFGRSYTSFSYIDAECRPGSTTEPTTVAVTVTNTGDRPGEEVVQLYVRDDIASVARPIRELVGFRRVALDPGAQARVTFGVHPSRLAFHDPTMALVTEPGAFTFWVGSASNDESNPLPVELEGPVAAYDRRTIMATTSVVEVSG
jgi:beta-glucosidase